MRIVLVSNLFQKENRKKYVEKLVQWLRLNNSGQIPGKKCIYRGYDIAGKLNPEAPS
jgi:hypothetical protein